MASGEHQSVKERQEIVLPAIDKTLTDLKNTVSELRDATKGIESHLGYLVAGSAPILPTPFQQSVTPIRARQEFGTNSLYLTVVNNSGGKITCEIEVVFEDPVSDSDPSSPQIPVSVQHSVSVPARTMDKEDYLVKFDLPQLWRESKGPRFVTVHIGVPKFTRTRHVLPATTE